MPLTIYLGMPQSLLTLMQIRLLVSRGVSLKLMKTLANSKCATFNEFVSDALTQENQNNIYSASKSHKRDYEAGASQSKAPIAVRPQFYPPAPKYRPP